MKAKRTSLYIRLAKLLMAGIVIAAAFFLLIQWASDRAIVYFLRETNYIQNDSDRAASDLQEYITKNNLSSQDTTELTRWVRQQKVISIRVYKNEILVYDSNYPDEAVWDADAQGGYYSWESYYTLTFSDGKADIFLNGLFEYRIFNIALITEILLSVILFMIIAVLGVRKTVNYIGKLKQGCEILGSGNLEYEITVEGRDELALLAQGLDNMRKALKSSIENEAQLTQANRRMITEMSHDLRTPLTSLMIYTEILRKKEIKDTGQIQEYIEKIDRKAHQIKQLSDNIFEYALITEETEVELGNPEPLESVFYDLLSEAAFYLTEHGYTPDIRLEKGGGNIRVNMEYINRILDNLVSNIIKYADHSSPVVIRSVYGDKEGGLSFENQKNENSSLSKKKEESTNIGIHNICKMMKKMHGNCKVEQNTHTFKILLQFPYT